MFVINLLILIFIPFLMLGIINKTKAFWGGRKGASIWQPWFDFIKLIKKEFVISETTTFVFNIAPVINFGAVLFASLFIPLVGGNALLPTAFGVIAFSYILGLGKFFSIISAMDTGSSFEGMGASREACFTAMVEPAFFMIIASIMALNGNYTFESLKNIFASAGNYGILITIFAVAVLFLMIVIECCRVPMDDPQTHLELTMIHEVMILDNSSMDLALFTYANALKMLLFSSLIGIMIIPAGLTGIINIFVYLLLFMLIAILIGTVESAMARIRMSHIMEFVFIMSSLALIVLSLVIVRIFGG
ncbi:NADH-quinone oxidoreductase subunit H [bacterium]|nr:NADH-quinone oxidoreductase subunit H [bacterium]